MGLVTRRPLLRIAAVLTASVLLLSGLSSVETPRAQAVDLSRFNPGLIITDRNFTDWSSMNAASIQAFLDARNPSCRPGNDGTPCLRAAVFDTWTRPADNRCRGTYVGAARESAATIIAKVAQACEISPKVLLVLLQKEQSLVTATGTSLTASRYRSATGFGCPDTAPCDAQYYGFYNQVYHAAWQFRNYTLYPERYNHRAGVVNNIRFHPNAACGSSPVRIQNQSTANLYNYTPYQPNAASLAAGSGTGDACSSYGNRNFYRFYTDWFGRPDAGDPIGAVESITATMSSITVSGWAIDPATNVSNQVHIYVSSVGYAVNANLPRPDVGAVFGMGPERGFSATFPASPGRHAVCTYSIGVERPQVTLLGCRTVDVVNRPPMGVIDAVAINEGQLTVAGWAFDPDSPGSTDVHVYVNGVG
ncbi:MAG: hypothetical protein FWD18_03860, partial [Micrococcales bacterium]|nr:hypothetical protein [Micrococcales bacterium]